MSAQTLRTRCGDTEIFFLLLLLESVFCNVG